MKRLVVQFLAVWTQAVLIGIPCVIWGWRGLVCALIGWTVALVCFELGKSEVLREHNTGSNP